MKMWRPLLLLVALSGVVLLQETSLFGTTSLADPESRSRRSRFSFSTATATGWLPSVKHNASSPIFISGGETGTFSQGDVRAFVAEAPLCEKQNADGFDGFSGRASGEWRLCADAAVNTRQQALNGSVKMLRPGLPQDQILLPISTLKCDHSWPVAYFTRGFSRQDGAAADLANCERGMTTHIDGACEGVQAAHTVVGAASYPPLQMGVFDGTNILSWSSLALNHSPTFKISPTYPVSM